MLDKIKNKMALRLSLYFMAALLVFAIIIGIVFMLLFNKHTMDLHKAELENRATSIAATLSPYLGRNSSASRMGGMMGYGAYLRFIGDIAGTDIWIVDENLNLVTSGMGHGMMGGGYEYSDLPVNAEELIEEVFTDKTVFSEGFSDVLSEVTLTVGVPVKDISGNVIAVVLLHSPVHGANDAVYSGFLILGISIFLALALTFALSAVLAKSFTDPIVSKEAMDALKMEKIRRDFIANISHELRTPVTVLRGSLEALTEKVVTDPVMVEEYHNQMLNETKFLQRLVGDLLDLSKLQNAEFAIEKSEVSVCDVIDDVIRSLTPVAEKRGVIIAAQKHNKSCMIYGDYGRLRQMLMIVLDNAIKFSPKNGTVEVVFKDNTISVRDYGIGIPKEDLPYIFDRFYRTRSEQNKTGTGLGLAIAKQIADRHNINFAAYSGEDKGAVFTFKMP